MYLYKLVLHDLQNKNKEKYHKKGINKLLSSLILFSPSQQPTMDSSSSTLSRHTKLVQKQCEIFCPTVKLRSSRRSPSFSSSSSSLSPSSSSTESLYFADDPLLSPASPLRFSGVPFSWEQLPGIPKKQNSKKKQDASMKLLPLPPPTTTSQYPSKKLSHNEEITRIRRKNSIRSTFKRDPFFAALMECSKDDDDERSSSFWNGPKVSRSISDRFGFINLYGSCKSTCNVSESIIYLPSSRTTTYDHLGRRSL